ncbi:hypothetical protein MJO28_010405 [Puccinia striiformis f. sp. tritici]|nr:hypothetical protein MJO28_010405 [Puccinia striiformis f. sp. tritici]
MNSKKTEWVFKTKLSRSEFFDKQAEDSSKRWRKTDGKEDSEDYLLISLNSQIQISILNFENSQATARMSSTARSSEEINRKQQQQQQQQSSTTTSNTTNLEPITPEGLLKLVRLMRTNNHNNNNNNNNLSVHSRAASNASSATYDDLKSLSLTIPVDPLQKRTMAETLDLSHQRIADLTQPVLEELAEYVERLALGYNYLPVLPDHFAILGDSLRYLNLRGNQMEIFPEVLTRMPSLEILDVSRNKIKAFPRRPGSLDRLRVLSVSRNRIKRLPNYVANLTTLRVLKIDHNPVIWPPKELVTFTDLCERADEVDEGVDLNHQVRDDDRSTHHTRTRTHSNETNTSMAHWLRTLQEWMRKNPYVRPVKQTRPSTGETSADPSEFAALRATTDFERSFNHFKGAQSPDISPAMTLSNGPASSPIPPSSIPATRNNNNNSKTHDHMLQHNRNASSSSTTQWVRKRPELRLKKSLPDLRRNHAEIMVERNADMDRAYFDLNRSPNIIPPNSSSSVTFSLNSPGLMDRGPRSAMALSNGTSTPGAIHHNPPLSSKNTELDRLGGTQIRRMKIGTTVDQDSLSGDRNSGAYFRRLSMLPASTISKQVPTPLLQLMDGIRGILFSLSQIYAALKQFVMFATQDRLPGALSRMISAADDSMGKLINALDRFDSSTRRAQPELEIVLQVFKSCKDNLIVFDKLVNVLSIQLKVLTGSADVRYSRTLLLSLYGATAEIAMSWQTITPLIDDVISLPSLRKSKPSPVPIPEENHHHHHHHSSSSDFAISRDKLQIDQESCSSSSSNKQHPSINQHHHHPISPNQSSYKPVERRQVTTNNLPPPSLPLPSYATFPPSPSTASEPNSNNPFGMSGSKFEGGLTSNSATFLNDEPRSMSSSSSSASSTFPSTTILRNPTSTNTSVYNRIGLDTPTTNRPPTSLPMLETGSSSSSSSSISKLSTDNYPSILSPGNLSHNSIPRSPALSSIASLNSSFIPLSNDHSSINHSSSSLEHPSSSSSMGFDSMYTTAGGGGAPSSTRSDSTSRPPPSSSSSTTTRTNTTMTEIPERTTSRHHHQQQQVQHYQHHSQPHDDYHHHQFRSDADLSRTDQDFLDMTQATIHIALSVTSMMLENLGQVQNSNDLDHHHHHHHQALSSSSIGTGTGNGSSTNNYRNVDYYSSGQGPSEIEANNNSNHQPESSSKRERKVAMAPLSTTTTSSPSMISSNNNKTTELKELCELVILVIQRLRSSLLGFWNARNTAASQNQNSNSNSNVNMKQGSNSSGSLTSIITPSSNTHTIHTDFQSIPATSSSTGNGTGGLEHDQFAQFGIDLQHDLDLSRSSPTSVSIESRKVFDDATAFVKAVIQTANLARTTMTTSTEYPLSKSIREGLGELTKATKELATLLAVSSFKPGGSTSSSSGNINNGSSSSSSTIGSLTSTSTSNQLSTPTSLTHHSNPSYTLLYPPSTPTLSSHNHNHQNYMNQSSHGPHYTSSISSTPIATSFNLPLNNNHRDLNMLASSDHFPPSSSTNH